MESNYCRNPSGTLDEAWCFIEDPARGGYNFERCDIPECVHWMKVLDFSADSDNKADSNVSVHGREEGCIGKYIPRGPRDFPRAWILHPEAREISRGRSPREISRAEGDVFPNASRLEAVYVHSLSISREVLILWCVFHLKLERSPSQCIGLH